ncbi:hypothetical protein CJF30_00000028 [Rutstroemia sp. NJR-2017a BBW]|nr:hypothetical protein CJF30_00000028 [Rutstroemia sp. NJR-2017a BBW]
MLLHRPFYHRR